MYAQTHTSSGWILAWHMWTRRACASPPPALICCPSTARSARAGAVSQTINPVRRISRGTVVEKPAGRRARFTACDATVLCGNVKTCAGLRSALQHVSISHLQYMGCNIRQAKTMRCPVAEGDSLTECYKKGRWGGGVEVEQRVRWGPSNKIWPLKDCVMRILPTTIFPPLHPSSSPSLLSPPSLPSIHSHTDVLSVMTMMIN